MDFVDSLNSKDFARCHEILSKVQEEKTQLKEEQISSINADLHGHNEQVRFYERMLYDAEHQHNTKIGAMYSRPTTSQYAIPKIESDSCDDFDCECEDSTTKIAAPMRDLCHSGYKKGRGRMGLSEQNGVECVCSDSECEDSDEEEVEKIEGLGEIKIKQIDPESAERVNQVAKNPTAALNKALANMFVVDDD